MKFTQLAIRFAIGICLIFVQLSCNDKGTEGDLFIENGKLKLDFDRANGALIGFDDVANNHQFLDTTIASEIPWEINFHPAQESKQTAVTPQNFEYSQPDALTLILTWSNFKGMDKEDFQIKAKITLDKEKALSYWKISLNGIEGQLIDNVVFPKINGIKDLEKEKLAIPSWMGQLLNDPRRSLAASKKEEKKMEWEYPGPLSLQCVSLYNPDKVGFYAASNDTLAYRKSFSFALDTSNNLTYQMFNFPAFDADANSYEPSYEAVIGSFKGDWITAAEQYREWGSKQKWATESRFKSGKNPKWLEETALWIWNRGRSKNVLPPAAHLKKQLGLPVNVFWHWWHGASYDEGFPEYLPPREGKDSFVSAMKSAQKQDIKSIVYMNSFQWGDATESWKTKNASVHAVKDINGELRSHAYNIFTGNSLTNMCMATPFWKDTYTDLSDRVVNEYGATGVYMDQACLNKVCYDAAHGHPLGGGNYWMNNFGKLTEQIRSKIPENKDPILAGEGGGESWMPYLDLFLTLQVSRERYSGIGDWETIPFFQAVYHQYAITYGNYSSLVTPPYDELWPKEFAPKNQEQPLDPIFNQQFLMEQARSYVWGMQPTISNYHRFLDSKRKEEIDYLLDIARIRDQGLKYMLYGEFLRAPHIESPEEELDISKLSIYAGREGKSVTAFKHKFPLVYSGAWKADDGSIGIPLTSISENNIPVHFSIQVEDYKLSQSGEIYITNREGRKLLAKYNDGKINVDYELFPREVCFIEIIPEI